MPITNTGLSHAVASTSQTEEATTSQAQVNHPLPSAYAAQNPRSPIFDRLSALPRELRQNIVGRLDHRSKARLGSTSRKMAAETSGRMQTLGAADARYDGPVAYLRDVYSLFPIHNLDRMMAPVSAQASQTVDRKLRLKHMENLGSASSEKAAAAREKLQVFLAANPDYNPIADFGEVNSLERLHAAMQLVEHLPSVGDEGRGARERAYFKLAYCIWGLPESERGEAFKTLFAHREKLPGQVGLPVLTPFIFQLHRIPGGQPGAPLAASDRGQAFMTLLAHINALPVQSGLPALEYLTESLVDLPDPECEPALRAVLQTPLAAHDQVALKVMEQAEKTGLGALSPHARLLVLALTRLPLPECMNIISEVAAEQPGPRARAVAVLYHQALLNEGDNLRDSYESVAEKLASSITGRDVLPHLAEMSISLPFAQTRFAVQQVLLDTCSKLYRDGMSKQERLASHEITASILMRLTEGLSQIPRAKRFESAWQLAQEAKSLDPERRRSVILAIRARADAILPGSVGFRTWCDEELERLTPKRAVACAPGLRFW